MAKRIQVLYEGQMVAADQLEFEAEKEPFSVYKLEDGSVMKIKTILGNISRLVDRYRPDGDPIYVFSVGGMPIMDVPPELRQRATEVPRIIAGN